MHHPLPVYRVLLLRSQRAEAGEDVSAGEFEFEALEEIQGREAGDAVIPAALSSVQGQQVRETGGAGDVWRPLGRRLGC